MNESEIIRFDDIPVLVYYELIKDSVKYALISLPFTINRMNIGDVEKRIENIAKGKIAEKLFAYYCELNSIPADFKTTVTPFYLPDKRDFLLLGYEWDIKNNFLHHNGNQLSNFVYTDLPALIPDRHSHDQWSKREKVYFDFSKGVRFLFTFLKSSDKNSRKQFIEINLSESQKCFLIELTEKYSGKEIETCPFDETWFWGEMKIRKDEYPSLQINDFPNLVITGYADSDLWNQFKSTNSGSDSNFQDYIKPEWYRKVRKESLQMLNFMDGTLWTRIPNATLPVSRLKSFKSLVFEK